MTVAAPTMDVEPLRASLLALVAQDAARDLEQVRAERAARLDEARREAAAIVTDARSAAEREARAALAHRIVRARRSARTVTLAAQRDSFEALRAEARTAALARRDDPGYPALLARLAEACRAQLGADAELQVDAPELGGVIATHGDRRVDYTLPALAERAITDLGTETERLWR